MTRTYLHCSVLLLVLISPPVSAAESKETKRVLVLYSEGSDNPSQVEIEQAIRAGFRSDKHFEVQVYTEYLDVSRFGDPAHGRAMADFLHRKYSGMKIDTIITIYPYALDFLLAGRRELFPEVPVVAALIIRSYAENLERSPARRFVTGTIVGDDVAGLMDVALLLRPETKRVALVAGTAPTDLASEQIYRAGLRPYAGRIGLIDLTKLSLDETLSRVGSLSPDTVVFYSSIFRDGAGKNFFPREVAPLIARASKAPVFNLYEIGLGLGIVGGRLASLKEHGKEAAALALRVMGGESPGSIPFGGEQAYVSTYDWRELKRWGISEKALPPGSIVRFKPPSLWEEHGGEVLAGLFFVSIETLLVIGLFVNLHKRRRAEAEIAASVLRYRTVADYTHGWEYWSAPDGALNYVSPSCERITGYSMSEFMGDPSLFLEVIVPEDKEIWDRHDHDSAERSKPQEIQFRIRTKGGEIRWIDHTCLPVKDAHGKFWGVRASNRDITDRKKAEADVQQQRTELAHVTRVAAIGELTSSLAHELNQPLAAIRNYANAAQRFLSHSEPNLAKAREALEGIVRDDSRAAEVISGLRGFLKRGEPCYGPLSMNNVIEDSLAFIRSDSVLEDLSIETELDPTLPTVLGDRIQLQQVLLNLMLNALDATRKAKPDSRKIVIKTENVQDQSVRVSVMDFGEGIDETRREKLFEPFYTTKPGGMGMGLAISARIIRAHSGSIWGENNHDRGATFSFSLPATGK